MYIQGEFSIFVSVSGLLCYCCLSKNILFNFWKENQLDYSNKYLILKAYNGFIRRDSSMSEEKRKTCAYGAKCYRKNDDHLKKFFHPTDDVHEKVPSILKF